MKVITFSRFFPVKHPRAGEPTYFVEKLLLGLLEVRQFSIGKCCELAREAGFPESHPMYYIDGIRSCQYGPKHHTIRAGNRWKVGDQFSPRVWSGKPYQSKQVQFAPPITIEKIWEFSIIDEDGYRWFCIGDQKYRADYRRGWHAHYKLIDIAKNDGLDLDSFMDWFMMNPNKDGQLFTGQILCWNKNINY